MLLAHDDTGSGAAVLLLHAGVADRRMWAPLTPALSHAFRVVAPDLRGFGESPLPGGEYADADDVADLLDHLGIERARVVGSSYGGRVALELATAHPARVADLVLLCPGLRGVPSTPTIEEFGAQEDRLLESGDLEGAVALNVATWLGPEADPATRASLTAMQRRAFEVQLAADEQDPPPQPRRVEVDLSAVNAPCLVVSGEHDVDQLRAIADLLVERVPGAEGLRLPWAGHLPSMERPDAVLSLLLDVLREDPTVHAP